MKFKIICNGILINSCEQTQEEQLHSTMNESLDVIPPIGSIIEYVHYENDNEFNNSYRVIGIKFFINVARDHYYTDTTCTVEVEKIQIANGITSNQVTLPWIIGQPAQNNGCTPISYYVQERK